MSERHAQKSYWQSHSSQGTVEEMLLDSNASALDSLERPEVLRMLGSVKGKRVVELGAGIGRFTGPLAAQAASVLAVDFMANLIDKNRATNGHMSHVDFKACDVLELERPPGSADVVFSNWLLMYLCDDELREGSTLFFRESCFRQSGDKPRSSNPTHYRNPRDYFAIVDGIEMVEPDGRFAHFELVSCRCVDAYVRVKKNQNQICFKWRKVVCEQSRDERNVTFRSFLDSQQYSRTSILRYERIFGAGFVSTGGLQTTQEFLEMLALKPGEQVLDVGCGIGGGDFYMADKYGVRVHGVDLSVNMVLLALERASAATLGSQVSFEIADVTACELAPASFDVIYSRDTILHIADKPALFRRFYEVLKPGGRLLISDYCRADALPSPDFAAYINSRGYDLHSVSAYGAMLKAAGFAYLDAQDRTHQFEEVLRRELKAAQRDEAAFVADFSQADYDYIVKGWQAKLDRVAAGDQKWGLFLATKPAADADKAANGHANGHVNSDSNGYANGHI